MKGSGDIEKIQKERESLKKCMLGVHDGKNAGHLKLSVDGGITASSFEKSARWEEVLHKFTDKQPTQGRLESVVRSIRRRRTRENPSRDPSPETPKTFGPERP